MLSCLISLRNLLYKTIIFKALEFNLRHALCAFSLVRLRVTPSNQLLALSSVYEGDKDKGHLRCSTVHALGGSAVMLFYFACL